jgi:hypothetical protein
LDLSSRHLIDIPFDGVEALSTDALNDEIKDLVAGPSTWSPISLKPPTILSQQTFALPFPASSAQDIFPSATHIIAYVKQSDGCTSLQCLDARTGNLVWSRERPGHEVRMAKFDLRSSTSAVMALSFSDPCVLSDVPIRSK